MYEVWILGAGKGGRGGTTLSCFLDDVRLRSVQGWLGVGGQEDAEGRGGCRANWLQT